MCGLCQWAGCTHLGVRCPENSARLMLALTQPQSLARQAHSSRAATTVALWLGSAQLSLALLAKVRAF